MSESDYDDSGPGVREPVVTADSAREGGAVSPARARTGWGLVGSLQRASFVRGNCERKKAKIRRFRYDLS